MIDDQDARLAFEGKHKSYNLDRYLGHTEGYRDAHTDARWQGWKACWERVEILSHALEQMNGPLSTAALVARAETAEARASAFEAREAGLRAALEPFAVGTDIFFSGDPDDRVVSIGRWYGGGPLSQELPRFNADIALTVSHFRRARASLSPETQVEP